MAGTQTSDRGVEEGRPGRSTTIPLRRPLIGAAIAICAFQVVDVLSTRALLRHGFNELNPLAGFLIAAGWLLIVKMGLAAGLLGRFARKAHPTTMLLCASWLLVGTYACIALGNCLALAR